MQQGTDEAVFEIIASTLESNGVAHARFQADDVVAAVERAGYLIRRPDDEEFQARDEETL